MDQVNRLIPYTMIALHLRDSTLHLITASQEIGPGSPSSFGGSSFRRPELSGYSSLLLIISATSIGSGVIQLIIKS